mgnify:CR=1 FL=1
MLLSPLDAWLSWEMIKPGGAGGHRVHETLGEKKKKGLVFQLWMFGGGGGREGGRALPWVGLAPSLETGLKRRKIKRKKGRNKEWKREEERRGEEGESKKGKGGKTEVLEQRVNSVQALRRPLLVGRRHCQRNEEEAGNLQRDKRQLCEEQN